MGVSVSLKKMFKVKHAGKIFEFLTAIRKRYDSGEDFDFKANREIMTQSFSLNYKWMKKEIHVNKMTFCSREKNL